MGLAGERWVWRVWGLAVVAVLVNTFLGWWNINRLVDDERMVSHTRQVTQSVNAVLRLTVDAETATRGYVITGERKYREPYDLAEERVRPTLDDLDRLTRDNPFQMANVIQLREQVTQKFVIMAKVNKAVEDRVDAAAIVREGNGNRAMEEIRTLTSTMVGEENRLLAEREDRAGSKLAVTVFTLLLGSGLSLGIGGVGFVLGRRHLAAMDAAQRDATAARIQSAEALAQLDAFVDNAPVGIAYFDTAMRYLRINPRLAAANGIPVADHMGKTPWELMPDFPADVFAPYEEVLKPGAGPVSFTVDRPDLPTVWQLTVFPVRDADGWTVGAGGIAEDVTARVRAEKEVREREARFRTLTETVPQIVWVARPDGDHEYHNAKWHEYTGLTPEQSAGDGWSDALHPDDRARSKARWKHATDTGHEYSTEHRFRRADGEYRWFLARALPQRDEAGTIVRWFGTCTDIHVAKLAANEAAERGRVAALRADVGFALDAGGDLAAALRRAVDTIVRHADAAFARVWTTDAAGEWLELQASAGCYTHTDGPHGRVRVGEFKIGRIAASARPHLSNSMPTDPEVSDPAWAKREGMVAFAGYPLVVEGRVLGVLALFAKHPLSDQMLDELGPVADRIAQYLDRRRTADTLRASEARFRTLTEAIPNIVWNADPDGRFSYVNARWTETTGLSLTDAQDEGWTAAVHPDDRPDVMTAWRETVRAAVVGKADRFSRELRLQAADGYRWFLTVAMPLRRTDGSVDQWIGSMADIHDQKRAAEAIAVSESRFRTLTETLPQMVWTADPTGRVNFFNTRWTEYTGLDLAQTNQPDNGLIHPDDADRLEAEWSRTVAEQPEMFASEFRVRRGSDGAYRWMLSTAVPLRNPDGALAQWVGSLTDIQDQKQLAEILEEQVRERTAALTAAVSQLRDEVAERQRAEDQLRVAGEELSRSNRELEQFASVASHDLQEPLRKIQAFGDRLRTRNREQLDDSGKEAVDRMLASSRRMRQLINDLLTFSRVSIKPWQPQPVDLEIVARDVLSDLEDRVNRSGGRVSVGSLPTIPAEPTQMRQLLQNLIGNALKFARPGVTPVVTVNVETLPTGVRLTVADNGIGFDEKYLDRIFQVFQRLHGRDEYEGTGVGLAVCRKIAERHGGTITARSVPGEGSTFVVDLPVPPT